MAGHGRSTSSHTLKQLAPGCLLGKSRRRSGRARARWSQSRGDLDLPLSPPVNRRRTAARLAALTFIAAVAAAGGHPPDARAAGAPDIVPHRALYEMKLAGTRSSSQVAAVTGRMAFEWADACDGWAIQQRFHLNFQYAEGNQVEMVTNYVTWESKDGTAYRFNVRRTVNGEVEEETRGEASLFADRQGGVVRYVRPEPTEGDLPPETMFPTAHTLELLRLAVADERFLARIVFDGSDADGPNEVSAAIGTAGPVRATPGGSGRDLLKAKAYPIRMAFFPLQGTGAEPTYEMSLSLLANGVAESMLIDYGDFRVSGTLRELESLPMPHC